MAKEIEGISTSGTLYARIKNSAGNWWNGTTFETYAAGNYSTYDVAMTEEGNSGLYTADFPSGIVTSGTYKYFVHRQAGASPAEGDTIVTTGTVDWTGTASVSAGTGAMSAADWVAYVLRCGFKRTDKNTEIYEATTDAIQDMRRRFGFDEAGTDTTTTDTIAVLGDFKLDMESDSGLLLSVTVQDGTDADPLERISKAEFDQIYPDINVTSDRGYPQHYCVYAGSLYIGPIPDSIAYTYRLSYSKRAGTVTSATTGVPFTNLYRDVLCDNVLARLYKGLEEFDKANYHKGAFEEGFLFAMRRENYNTGASRFNVQVQDC